MGLTNKFTSLIVLLIAIYMASPVIFKYSTFIQRNLLFMNYVNTQFGRNLSHPEAFGIKCSRTLTLSYTDKFGQTIDIGAWHIVPESRVSDCTFDPSNNRTSINDKLAFSDQRPIILYVHGNGGNRGGEHRSRLYRKLAYEFDFHVVTFDYRGYGDSTNLKPTVEGVTSDAGFIYNWLLKQLNVDLSRVAVWGHSLGTAVATRMVSNEKEDRRPSRLILEAPFDSVGSAIRDHPFSAPFRMIPYFEYFFIEPVVNSPELNFDSSKSITKLKTTKVLILHAEDDGILPISLGRRLYEAAREKLGKLVSFIQISSNHGLGHKLICLHDETMHQVRKFIEATIN